MPVHHRVHAPAPCGAACACDRQMHANQASDGAPAPMAGRHAQHIQRRQHTRARHGHAERLQAHLDPGKRAHQGQIVEIAEMADPEHAALEPAQALAERHVETRQDQLAAAGRRRSRTAGICPSGPPNVPAPRGTGCRDPKPAWPHAWRHRSGRAVRTPRSRPSSSSIGDGLFQAIEQIGRRRVGKEAAAIECPGSWPSPNRSVAVSPPAASAAPSRRWR